MTHQLEDLYKEYFPRIYSFLYRMCADPAVAEELTQETFYQAYLSFHKFKGQSEFYTWLVGIAKHVHLKYLRKTKKEFVEAPLDLVAEVLALDEEQPDKKLEKEFTEKTVQRLIKKLPSKYKDVVMLRVYAEMSFAQVAQTLNISENSAKVIFCRAKKMLAEELKNEFEL